jgi:xanthine dehydrogenase/oxidase
MKRGISVVPIKFYCEPSGVPYTVLVNIYAEDGTVAIAHGGVEIGQGINTKVAQVAALTLGIPMVKISIKACSTVTSPNSQATGGSTTSEINCMVSVYCVPG